MRNRRRTDRPSIAGRPPRFRAFLSLAVLASVLAPAPLSATPPSPGAEVLAEVGGARITAADLQAELGRRGRLGPGRAVDAAAARALLDELVQRAVLLAAARRSGLADRPEVRAEIDRLLVGRYRAEQIEPKLAALAVEPAEVEAWYREHAGELASPPMVRAAMIRVAVSPKAPPEARDAAARRAAEARAEAVASAAATPTFGSVAVRYSEDQATRYRGGDLGWLARGATGAPREVVEAAFGLAAPGEVGPVLALGDGFYLVKLIERRDAATPSLDQVRERLAHRILAEKRARTERELLAALAAGLPIRIDPKAVDEFVAATGAKAPPSPPPLPAR